MMAFLDGPANGITLNMHRAPVLLRVVGTDKGRWDCLNDPGDTIQKGEEPFPYILTDQPDAIHICNRGRGRTSGWYYTGVYRFLDNEPTLTPEIMRDNEAWAAWCDANADRLKPEWFKEVERQAAEKSSEGA